jgi:hypothetical protein
MIAKGRKARLVPTNAPAQVKTTAVQALDVEEELARELAAETAKDALKTEPTGTSRA